MGGLEAHCAVYRMRVHSPQLWVVHATPADAWQYAVVFDRAESADLGRRAPLIGFVPLRLARLLRRLRTR